MTPNDFIETWRKVELKERSASQSHFIALCKLKRPAWLDNAHKALDEAVAEAYGWGDDERAGKLTADEILARLFALNQQRAGK